MQTILRALSGVAVGSVIATDDSTVELASAVAQRLGLPHNSPDSSKRARFKDLGRASLARHKLLTPAFQKLNLSESLHRTSLKVDFPCVIKPLALSASRGVIRVNDFKEFRHAVTRVKSLLDQEGVTPLECLIEDYVPGIEVAVEGFVQQGHFSPFCIFDKPDAGEGPYFEETYYITPSRHRDEVQNAIFATVQNACTAYGLRECPVHAECRVNEKGVWIIELAARTIGGECSRVFDYIFGQSLEEVVIKNALRISITGIKTGDAAGVLMLPVKRDGVLRRVEGVRAAGQVRYIEQVIIDVRPGQELIPWPEGGAYPGFILARGPTPHAVDSALREAHAKLNFVVAPKLSVSVAA